MLSVTGDTDLNLTQALHSRSLQFVNAWSLTDGAEWSLRVKVRPGVGSALREDTPSLVSLWGSSHIHHALLCEAPLPTFLTAAWPPLAGYMVTSPPWTFLHPTLNSPSCLPSGCLPSPWTLVPLLPLGCPPFSEIASTQPWCPFERHPIFSLFCQRCRKSRVRLMPPFPPRPLPPGCLQFGHVPALLKTLSCRSRMHSRCPPQRSPLRPPCQHLPALLHFLLPQLPHQHITTINSTPVMKTNVSLENSTLEKYIYTIFC